MYKFPEHYIMEFDQTSTQDTIHVFVFPRHSNQPFLVELNFDAQLAIIVKKNLLRKHFYTMYTDIVRNVS